LILYRGKFLEVNSDADRKEQYLVSKEKVLED